MKNCLLCGKEFQENKKTERELCYSCITRQRREKNKLELIKEAGGKCKLCGYNKELASLNFVLKDNNEKFTPYKDSMKLEKSKELIKKCYLLCTNCLRELQSINQFPLEAYSKYIVPQEIRHKNKIDKKNEKEERILNKVKEMEMEENKNEHIKPYFWKVKRPSLQEFEKKRKELKDNKCAIGRFYGVSNTAIKKWIKTYEKYPGDFT